MREIFQWLQPRLRRLDVMDLVAGVAAPAVVLAGFPWVLSYLFSSHSLTLPEWVDMPWLMTWSAMAFAFGLLSSTLVAWHTRLRLVGTDSADVRDRRWLTFFGLVDLSTFAWMVTVVGFEARGASIADATGLWWLNLVKFVVVGGGLEIAVLGSLYSRTVHQRLSRSDRRFEELHARIVELENSNRDAEKSKSALFAAITGVASHLNGKGASGNTLRCYLQLLSLGQSPISERELREGLGASSSLGSALEALASDGYVERVDARSVQPGSSYKFLYRVVPPERLNGSPQLKQGGAP